MRAARLLVPASGLLAAVLALSVAAAARADAPRDGAWLALGFAGGPSLPDARLADYQWDVAAHGGWGGELLAGRGRWAGGLRLWRTATTQSTGLADVAPPAVRATSLEAVAEARVAARGATALLAVASAGRLHLGYAPDHATTQVAGTPIELRFAPIDAWIGGGGLALRHALGAGWSAGLEVDRRAFALDTTHRAGAAIVERRESFGDWSARVTLARLLVHR